MQRYFHYNSLSYNTKFIAGNFDHISYNNCPMRNKVVLSCKLSAVLSYLGFFFRKKNLIFYEFSNSFSEILKQIQVNIVSKMILANYN